METVELDWEWFDEWMDQRDPHPEWPTQLPHRRILILLERAGKEGLTFGALRAKLHRLPREETKRVLHELAKDEFITLRPWRNPQGGAETVRIWLLETQAQGTIS